MLWSDEILVKVYVETAPDDEPSTTTSEILNPVEGVNVNVIVEPAVTEVVP